MKRLSLLLACFLSFSCGKGPQLEVCVIDYGDNMGRCFDQESGTSRDIPLDDLENYFAISPADFEELINYMRRRCR